MYVSAEALGPKSGNSLLEAGADEVLMPCIGALEDAIDKAARVSGPVTVHTPANRAEDPAALARRLRDHGIDSVLAVSGNPGHGRGTRTLYELIPRLREQGIHVSVGAYPEDYFTRTSRAHRAKSASILVDKQAAGADRVITQASFDTENLRKWLEVLRSRGVTVPVQVGVMAHVPRKTLGKFLRDARAEILSHPRLQLANRPNLDLLFRMLRSQMPSPEGFIRTVASMPEMGRHDGFHVFSYGADVTPMIEAAKASGPPRQSSPAPRADQVT